MPKVTDLRCLRQLLQSKLRFFIRAENAHLRRVGRRQHRAGVIEETVKARMRHSGNLIRLGIGAVLHDVPQLISGAWIKKIEGVVLESSVDPRLRHQRAAAFGERGVTKFLDPVQRSEVGLEIAQKILLERAGRVALRKVKAGRGQARDDEHHRDRKFRAKTGDR